MLIIAFNLESLVCAYQEKVSFTWYILKIALQDQILRFIQYLID